MNISQQQLLNSFCELENKHHLFSISSGDVPCWELIRYSVFEYLQKQRLGKSSELHPDCERSVGAMLHNSVSVLVHSFFHGPFLRHGSFDYLFFLAPRKIMTERGFVSPVIDYFIDELPGTHCIFEKPFHFRHQRYHMPRVTCYSDYYEVKRILFSLFHAGKNDAIRIAEQFLPFCQEMEQITGLSLPKTEVVQFLSFAIASWRACYHSFQSILRHFHVKCLVTVVHYEQANLIMTAAAHALQIPVVELQHGIISPLHAGYNRLASFERCLPDRILTWGTYWSDGLLFPKRQTRFVPCGYPYLDDMAYASNKDSNVILFISQAPVGEIMTETAIQLQKILEPFGWKIIYKLHPNECRAWKERYQNLSRTQSIHVIDSPDTSIYECFTQVAVQVGVSSTALIEGFRWKLRTYVINAPTHEYMRHLYGNNYAKLVSCAKEIADSILSHEEFSAPSDSFFWASNAKANIIRELQKSCKIKLQ